MKSISLKQRRFLIIWCCFHLFAIAANKIPIIWKFDSDGPEFTINSENYAPMHYKTSCSNFILTDGRDYDTDNGFYPFVKFFRNSSCGLPGREDLIGNGKMVFMGLFFNYNTGAFILYICLGFAIVFVPKLWGHTK